MDDETNPDETFQRLVDFFQRSRFEYLAVDYGGQSLRLSRDRGGAARASPDIGQPACVRAGSVGFVEVPAGRQRFAEAGEHVERGEPLFAIRRFRDVLAVEASASGVLHAVLVKPGEFVEFGQPLATMYICK